MRRSGYPGVRVRVTEGGFGGALMSAGIAGPILDSPERRKPTERSAAGRVRCGIGCLLAAHGGPCCLQAACEPDAGRPTGFA